MSKKYKRSHVKRQSNLDSLFESWEERNEKGDLVYYKDSNGFEEKITYDENGNVIRRETSDSIVIEKKYDDKNNEIYFRTNDGEDGTTRTIIRENTYDDNDRLIHCKNSYGFERSYVYDDEGRVIHTSDSNSLIEDMMYDKNGNRINYVASNGYFESQFFDDNGNVLYYRDSNGYSFHAIYNEDGNILYKCSTKNWFEGVFNTSFEQYEYDEKGNLVKIAYSDGTEAIYQYKSGHLDSIEIIDTNTKKIKSTKRYNKFGNIVSLKYEDNYILEADYEYLD